MPKPSFPAYESSLKEARKSVSGAAGDAHLALTCYALCLVHVGVNPGMLFDAAKKKGMTPRELKDMAHNNVGEFAFLQFA